MGFTITRGTPSNGDGPVELKVSGSIDLSTSAALVDAAATAMLISKALVIDASDVDFMDSSGVAALERIAALAQHEQATFAVTKRSPAVERVLDLVGVEAAWTLKSPSEC